MANDAVKTSLAPTPAAEAQRAKPARPLRRGIALALTAGLLCIGFFHGLHYALNSFTHESTDDAFLESHIVTVAPRVAGQVLAVHIKENQRVQKGEPLLELDPRDYEIQLAHKRAAQASAEANLASAQAGIELVKARFETAQATELQEKANAEAARAKADRAGSFFKRAQNLRQTHVISDEEYDRARADAESATADFQAAEQKAAASKSQVSETRAQITVARSVLEGMATKAKEAETEQSAAELQLSYTKVVSPCDGKVVRKNVEPGNYVQIGQSLLSLVTTQVWVVANFKESQLRDMRAGQQAQIRLDAYPNRVFRAHVDSFQAGSGSRFSLLPPENAVGNYVKIVQRVPVKLYFDEPLEPSMALGPGMSVVPEVRTKEFAVSSPVIWVVAVLLAALTTLAVARAAKHLRD